MKNNRFWTLLRKDRAMQISMAYFLLMSVELMLQGKGLAASFAFSPFATLTLSVIFLTLSSLTLYALLSSLTTSGSALKNLFRNDIFKSRILYTLVTLILLLITVPAINFGVLHWYEPKIRSKTQDQLVLVAKTKTEAIAEWLNSRKILVRSLAYNQELQSSIAQFQRFPNDSASKAHLHLMLSQAVENHAISGISILDANLQIIAQESKTKKAALLDDLAWISKNLEPSQPLIGNFFLADGLKLLIFDVTPMYLAQQPDPIYLAIHYDTLPNAQLLFHADSMSGNHSMLLSHSKRTGFHIDEDPALSSLTPSALEANSLFLESGTHLAGLGPEGNAIYAIKFPVNADWDLVVYIDQQTALAPFRVLLTWISALMLLATTVVSFVLLFLWMHQIRHHQFELRRRTLAQEQLLHRFFELPFIGMGICDAAGFTWQQVNSRVCEMFGYDQATLLKMTWLDLLHPDERPSLVEACQGIKDGTQNNLQLENRYLDCDGNILIIKSEVILSFDLPEQPVLMLVMEDVTALKSAIKALKVSEERLHLAFKGSKDGWWDMDLVQNTCFQSQSWWHMLGYETPLTDSDPTVWQQLSHPEDIEPIHHFISEMLVSTNSSYQLECQLRHRDGHFVPILTRGFITRNADGKAIRLSGTDTDITDRLQFEKTIKMQEQFNRALIENQSDAIIACDAQCNLVLFNHVARDWLGQDVLNIGLAQWLNEMPLYEIGTTERHDKSRFPLLRAIRGEQLQNEMIALILDGQAPRYIACSASSFNDSHGKLLGAVLIMRDITENLAHEASLQASESLYREMFDANPNPMWVIDAETGHFLAVNDAAINHYGWSRQEFLDMDLHNIQCKPHEDTSFPIKEALAFSPRELKHQKRDGTLVDVEITSNPLVFMGTNARLMMVNDVTDRKHAENEIRTANRLLLMLTNINQTIVRRLPTEQMFQEACTVAVRDGGFVMAWIGILNPLDKSIRQMAVAGTGQAALAQFEFDLADQEDLSPTMTALRHGQHGICQNTATDPAFAKYRHIAMAHGFASVVALPLVVNGTIVGHFSMYASEPGMFNQREMDLLDELANDISFALTVADVELERNLAEKALRQSESLFHTLASASPVGIFHTDELGEFLYTNHSWYQITDISLEDASQNGWLAHVYSLDRERIHAAWAKTLHQKISFNQEFRLTRRDARLTWVKCQIAVELDASAHFLGFVGTVTDITALKESEENNRMANTVFENTREGIMVTDKHNQIIMVNRACCDITQYAAEELIGKTTTILVSGKHDVAFYKEMWASLNNTGYWKGEIWNRRKNGEIYPELLSISVIRDESGLTTNYVAVFGDITSLKSSEEKLEFLAHHDPLTKLPNRLMLLSRLEHAIALARRDQTQLALLMLDLDRFKNVNDSFGHLAGDELLQQVAERLTGKLRSVDTVTRLGGDEFTILLESIASPEDAARVANNIIKTLESPWTLTDNIEVRIGASVGISLYPGHGDTALELLQHADAALYQAKAAGRGCARYFSEKLTQATRDRFNIESRLRLAIQNDELRVYFQPKLDVNTGQLIGAEALMRWQDKVEGMMLPERFVSIAEDTGLIRSLGEWVLRAVCQQGRAWLELGLKPIKIAVNISAHQLHHTDLISILDTLLDESGFPACYLELELTESILMNREQELIETLNAIRKMGITLAIDDFGTGYSSLAYLKSFPLDVLKIDKSFVADIEDDADDRAITATIIKIAHTLGLQVVAEGVENAIQLAFLQQHDCDMYQGFLASQAIPASAFEDLMQQTSLLTSPQHTQQNKD